jgi:histone H3/H4
MNHEQQLRNIRQWFSKHQDIIRVTAVARRMKLAAPSTLARALTDNVEEQRNVSPEFLKQIIDTFSSFNFDPKKDYAKAN